MHATAEKIDALNKESGNEAININQENHNYELSDGFKFTESQTKATYANQFKEKQPKKKRRMHQPKRK